METIPQDSSHKSRRLLVVLTVVVLIVVTGGSIYYWRLSTRAEHVENLKPRGLQHVQDGEYEAAMQLLSGYLGRNPNDVEALRGYAEAREHTYERGGAHIKQVVDVRRRILELAPDDHVTRRKLMKQYLEIGFFTEAIELADKLVSEDPNDPPALRVKARALTEKNQYEQALEVTQRYCAVRPNDVEMHMLAVRIIQAMGLRDQDAVKHVAGIRVGDSVEGNIAVQGQIAERMRTWKWNQSEQMRKELSGLVAQHGHGQAFMAVLGYAYHLNGDLNRAREAYKQAADRAPDNADEAGRLATLMDRLGLFDEATTLLMRAEQSIQDADVQHLYVRRLWERGQVSKLRERARSLELGGVPIDTDTVGICALALVVAGHDDPAERLIHQLEQWKDDELAASWTSLLRVLQDDSASPGRLEQVTAKAMTHFSKHPYFHYYHGEAVAGQGKTEEAIQAWQTAGQLAPAWPMPLVRMSHAFLQTGRGPLAAATAKAAVGRHPNDPQANIAFLQAVSPQLDQLTDDQITQLVEWADAFDTHLTAVARPYVLPIRIALRARAGEADEARGLITAALQSDDPISGTVWMQMAAVSAEYNLDMVDQCLDAYRRTEGATPAFAVAAAARIADAQGIDEAVAAFDRVMSQTALDDEGRRQAWEVARARLLDQLQHPEAVEEWQRLIERYAENAPMLSAAVDAAAPWQQRDVANTLVQQLAATAGSKSLAYRQAYAQLLTSNADASQRELAEAASLLLDVTREAPYLLKPHIQLAECFLRLDNPERALDLLQEAQALTPRSLDIALQRLHLHQQLDQWDQANRLIDQISGQSTATISQRISLAGLIAVQGDTEEAERRLKAILDEAPGHQMAKFWLANLLWDQQRDAEALAHFDELIETDDPQVLRRAIAFYSDQGDPEQVQVLLGKLEASPQVPSVDKAVLQARFAMRQGNVDQAVSHLRSIASRGEATPAAYRQLIAIQLQAGRVDAAIDSAEEAFHAFPDEGMFSAISEHRALVREASQRRGLTRLVASLLSGADYREAALEALQLVIDAEREGRLTVDVAVELRELADRHPSFLALQDLMIGFYQSTGRTADVVEMAVRTMRVLPDSPEAAWMAANALSAAGRWNEAQDAAWEYQRRLGKKTLASDMLIAESHLRLGRGSAAAQQLQPHLELDQSEATGLMLHQTKARALIQQERVEDARQLLLPELKQSVNARMAFMRLALFSVPDPDDAEQWLMDLEQVIDAGRSGERLWLANAWQHAGQRWRRSDHLQRAERMLRQLTEDPRTAGEAWQALGVNYEVQGEAEPARSAYRQALSNDPNLSIAANNLAMLLLRSDRGAEAIALAERAVAESPRSAAFQDTYALALMANGQPREAVAAARRAASLEQGNPEFYITLCEALVQADQQGQAREILARLHEAMGDDADMPHSLAERLQALRQVLGDSPDATEPTGAAMYAR